MEEVSMDDTLAHMKCIFNWVSPGQGLSKVMVKGSSEIMD